MKGGPDSRSGTIVVEGRWAVEALLDNPGFRVVEVLVEAGRHRGIEERALAAAIPCRELSAAEMASFSGYEFHRGVCAVAARPLPREPDEAFLAGAKRLLVPVDLADAGNLGTLLRSAAAFGVDGVILGAGRGVDVYSRKCIRSSATAVFRLPVFEVDSLEDTLVRCAEAGFVLLGATPGEEGRPLDQVRPARKTAVVLGSEGEGLPAAIARHCAEFARIPMHGGLDSLNVAVSGAILMWEWFGRGLRD